MTRSLRGRLGKPADAGAFAILYAVLVVVLLGMAAIVVDFASVREDRRLGRSATDSAALGGAEFLNAQAVGGGSPYTACLRAWKYLASTLQVAAPAGTCGSFAAYNTPASLSTCSAAGTQPAEIDDDRTVGNRTFRVAWPIPKSGGTGFLTSDIAPGNVTQTFAPGVDGPTAGTDWGCDRLGVAMFENAKFALGQVLGYSGTSTQVHSVARYNPTGGPAEAVAALNVLETTDCPTLRVTGGGKAIVGPTLDNGVVVGPGIIAVESDGLGGPCKSTTTAITLNGSGSSLCAASNPLNPLGTNCDGLGTIRSYAIDTGGSGYNPNDAPPNGVTLRPRPINEGSTYGWTPVTKKYGCEVIACVPNGPNYISLLKAKLGGSGIPSSNYAGSAAPYVDPFPGAFTDVSAYFCPKTPAALPVGGFVPGNYYVSCTLDTAGRTVIFKGGTLVVDGGLVNASGCFVMNAPTCTPTIVNAGTSSASITPAPARDALVYLRGDGFDIGDRLMMPQTFVFQAGSATSLNVKTTTPVFWTAPGAGTVTSGRTTLEQACFVASPSPGAVDQSCLNSRFSRLAYWSEYAASTTKPDNFGGQGSLSLVGVFFTPRAALNLTGGSGYSAASAQFWARYLDINGTGTLVLSPDARSAIASPTGLVTLIR